METKRRVGRPTKEASGVNVIPLGLRVPPEVKRILDDGAVRSGRSQSQEAAFRIKLTADWQKAAGEIRDLPNILAMAQSSTGKSWKDDPETCRIVMGLMLAWFRRFGPEDVKKECMSPRGADYDKGLDIVFRTLQMKIPSEGEA